MANTEIDRKRDKRPDQHQRNKAISEYSNEVADDPFLTENEKHTLLAFLEKIFAPMRGFDYRSDMPPYAGVGSIPRDSGDGQWNESRPATMRPEFEERRTTDKLPTRLPPSEQWPMGESTTFGTNAPNSVPTWLSMLKARSLENPLPPSITDILQSRSVKAQAASRKTWGPTVSVQSVRVPAFREQYTTELQVGIADLLDIRSESKKVSAVQKSVNMQIAASMASRTIRDVVNDPHFQQIIKHLAEQHDSDRWLIREAIRETKHLNVFLEVLERTLNEMRRYSNDEIVDLIKNCKAAFEDVKDGKASARELSKQLRELAGGADKLAQEIQIEIKGVRKRQQNTLERLLLGSFGLFLVTAFPAAASLSLIGQTIATNIGAALISRVLAERPDD